MTTPIPPCWSREEIQNVAQIDAGGLEFDDTADAVLDAVHQKVPLARLSKDRQQQPVAETDVLADICQPIISNEPLIRFITGQTGTGKSHLVRWLRTKVPHNDQWHLVYIEKRNTSLRRIIEQILSGIETAAANTLRGSLARAATQIATTEEAMLAVLNQLHQLVAFDDAPTIADLSGPDLTESRAFVARLIGDFTFKQQLSRPGGPVERIVKLAMRGYDDDANISPEDLHFRESDLRVDAEAFEDAGWDFQVQIRSLTSSVSRRTEAAAIIDYYVPRATAAVITGSSTDLLSVFEDVRGELARRGRQLFLFIEDLVLLHGIDGQLAQALTLPARHDLCPIRAVIAVTTGHLDSRYDTFAERGIHYTMDVPRREIATVDLRTLVGRYLNAGRVGRQRLADAARLGLDLPNKCTGCSYRDACHPAFGTTDEGHGLFPFNASAVDRLIELASPDGFDPRNILREVVRAPLEVAEAELATPGMFPSARFAKSLAPTRTAVPLVMRDTIMKGSRHGEAEISLRAFYAADPPASDAMLESIASALGVELTDLGEAVETTEAAAPAPATPTTPSAIDAWSSGQPLPRDEALKIRRWMIETLAARLLNHPHGLNIYRSGNSLRIGSVEVGLAHVAVENAAGGGEPPDQLAIHFRQQDTDAVLLKGILSSTGGDLAGPNGGRWFLDLNARLTTWEREIVERAREHDTEQTRTALAVLGVLSSTDDRSPTSPAEAIAVMVRPQRPADLHPQVISFLGHVERQRIDALTVVRDRLTQRKSTGLPTIFDAGAVLRELLPAARLGELPVRPAGDPPIWRAVRDRQAAAAAAAWSPVKATLTSIAQQVGPGEDLTETLQVMERFVTNASRAGVFRDPDAPQQFSKLRGSLTPDRLTRLRQLLKHRDAATEPADLWHLAHDPTQLLNDTAAFWRLCDRLLLSMRTANPLDGSPAQAFDRKRLHAAFRTLAERLESQATR